MIRARASRSSTEGRRSTSNRRCRCLLATALALLTLLTTIAVAQPEPPPTDAEVTSQRVPSRPQPHVARWWQSIGWGILLLIILAASTTAIVAFSRRYRTYLWPESREPTPIDDVWAMDRLTDDADAAPANGDEEDSDTPPA